MLLVIIDLLCIANKDVSETISEIMQKVYPMLSQSTTIISQS